MKDRIIVVGYALAVIVFMVIYAVLALLTPIEALKSMGQYFGKMSQTINERA